MGDIEIKLGAPGDVLKEYHRDRSRCSFIMGPLGSGKTFQTCQKILKLMCEQEPNQAGVRPSRWFAIRNTYPDLQTTTINDWLELWGSLGEFTNGNPPSHKLEFGLDDGTIVKSEMIFLALDRADAIKKLRGTQATGFWLNETKELIKGVVDMADLRHGRYPTLAAGGVKATWHGMVGDTNAPDEDHWYHTLAEADTPEWSFYRQPGGLFKDGEEYVENPDAENLQNLPEGYYVKGQVGKSKEWINVNLCNEYGFVSDGKPIYPEYTDSIHSVPRIEVFERLIYIGIDFGLTPAAAFAQQRHAQWQFIDELVTDDMGAVRFADNLSALMRGRFQGCQFKVYGDPSGDSRSQVDERTPIKVLKAAGIPCVPAPTNDPLVRREAVARHMSRLTMTGKPGIVVSSDCKMLRKAWMGGYCFRRLQVVGDERFTDRPDKNMYSHIAEAAEYAMVGAGEGRSIITSPMATNVKLKKSIRPRPMHY